MTAQELSQLEDRAEQLWQETQALWQQYIDKADQWRTVNDTAKEQRSKTMVKQPT